MYIPKYFSLEEFFSEEFLYDHGKHEKLWRLMDERLLWTADQLRKRYGTMILNDYKWRGRNQLRGYRSVKDLLDKYHVIQSGQVRAEFSTFTSQHCFGRALDAKFSKYRVGDVRVEILAEQDREEFQFITAVEMDVSWLHIDVRNWDKKVNGILTFKG